jgi:putative ABC transport system substrate-binding protein
MGPTFRASIVRPELARKVLRAAKPEELPAERPTRFQLIANLNTAKKLGLELPPMLLARADEVIE